MATAAIYGLLAGSSFVVGVLLGLATKPPCQPLAVVIAFGAGVLVSALTFDLMGETLRRRQGPMPSLASWSAQPPGRPGRVGRGAAAAARRREDGDRLHPTTPIPCYGPVAADSVPGAALQA
jgi:ZIP family zinc transporter